MSCSSSSCIGIGGKEQTPKERCCWSLSLQHTCVWTAPKDDVLFEQVRRQAYLVAERTPKRRANIERAFPLYFAFYNQQHPQPAAARYSGNHFTSERFQSISLLNVLAPDYTTEHLHMSRYYVSNAKVFFTYFLSSLQWLWAGKSLAVGCWTHKHEPVICPFDVCLPKLKGNILFYAFESRTVAVASNDGALVDDSYRPCMRQHVNSGKWEVENLLIHFVLKYFGNNTESCLWTQSSRQFI